MSVTSTISKKMWQMATSFVCNHKRVLIEIFSVVAFVVICVLSISKCAYYKNVNEQNIIALTDSVQYYKGKLGNEVASKTMVEGDYTFLKNINDSLYRLVESMKVKNPETVIGSKVTIDNGTHDTVYVPTLSEIESKNIYKEFDFSDRYRELAGNVRYANDTLGLYINKDKVNFNYALSIKDGTVYMTSDNPYVKFSDITGLKIPETKKEKRFGVGPGVFVGFGNKGFNYGVGIGIQYNLWKF